MKYETPELTTLTNAVNAIQTTTEKNPHNVQDNIKDDLPETVSAYADWE
jgi:hypothetical protein